MDYTTALHGDVAGFSALMADNEIETFRTMKRMRSIVETSLVTNSGELADFVGDEFLAVFSDVRQAVGAAVEMQRQMTRENLRLAVARRARFRLGVHMGAVNFDEGSYYGDGITIAARLQALADPGGVVISSDVLESVGDIEIRIEGMGPQRLKNIPEPVRAFKLVDDDLPVEADKPWRRRVVRGEAPTLAIVPFVNLGGADDDFFASGLTISLISSLVKIPGIDVISGNSTIGYTRKMVSADRVGVETGVRYVLEGAVQRSPDRVRVVAQLLDTFNDQVVWSERFESVMDDMFSTQDDLMEKIVAVIDAEGIGELGRPVSRMMRDQLDAQSVDLVYRGQDSLIRATPEGTRKAQELFEQVMERTPESAIGPAMAGWAYLWELLLGYAINPDDNVDRAESLANEAQRVGDTTGFSYAVMAYVNLLRRKWDQAYEAAIEATAKRPSCDASFGVAGSVMRFLGQWEEAVELAGRAADLSPARNNWYQTVLANSYLVGADHEMAADIAEDVVANDEHMTEALLTLAASQVSLGKDRHASAAIRQAQNGAPGLTTEEVRKRMPFKEATTLEAFIERLSKAGLGQ